MPTSNEQRDFYAPKKRVALTPEEVEKAQERLYTRSVAAIKKREDDYREAVDFQMTHNDIFFMSKNMRKGALSPAEERAVEHLYSQPMARKKANQEKLEKKLAPVAATTKTVSPEEREAVMDRLYAQSIQRKRDGVERAEKKFYVSSPRKVLNQDQLKQSIESLYTKAVQKKKESDEKLESKYTWKQDHSRKLTEEDVKSLGGRLATKTGK